MQVREITWTNGIKTIIEREQTQEEIQTQENTSKESIRGQRNNLLSRSDWTQVADAPVDKAAWAVYRQELRDITAQAGFPTEVIWPTKPE